MTIGTIADITPNSTATPLVSSAASPAAAAWVALTATGSSCRWGDSNVGSSRGQKLPTGVPVVIQLAQMGGLGMPPLPLNKIYVYATGADAISITYGC